VVFAHQIKGFEFVANTHRLSQQSLIR
jgi:hypothetical protein